MVNGVAAAAALITRRRLMRPLEGPLEAEGGRRSIPRLYICIHRVSTGVPPHEMGINIQRSGVMRSLATAGVLCLHGRTVGDNSLLGSRCQRPHADSIVVDPSPDR